MSSFKSMYLRLNFTKYFTPPKKNILATKHGLKQAKSVSKHIHINIFFLYSSIKVHTSYHYLSFVLSINSNPLTNHDNRTPIVDPRMKNFLDQKVFPHPQGLQANAVWWHDASV